MAEPKVIYNLRIVYKSGYQHDFEVYKFEVKGGSWSWESVNETNKPLMLGVDNIESVWTIGQRFE